MNNETRKEIFFGTKEESIARREREFLALSPHERFLSFLRGFTAHRIFPIRENEEHRHNLILTQKNGPAR